jgi:hypothetical protein
MIGKAAAKAPEQKWFEVLVEPANGGKIHGARRKVGDVFEAPASAMVFPVLEGLVAETEAPAPAAG